VRLGLFRHPFGAIGRDLLLGSRRGTRWRHADRPRSIIRWQWHVLGLIIQGLNRAVGRVEDLLEGRRHILQQRQAVGDRGRLWRPLPHARGIGFYAVTDHNRDIGMGVEPRGNGFRRPILEYVEGPPRSSSTTSVP
jgi:hypothetical protein